MPLLHPDIIRINTAYANTYLIRNGNKSVLVDTGLERSGRIVLQGIADAGLKPSDIRLIILTHPHFDHCNGAAAIRDATGAQVMETNLNDGCVEGLRVPALRAFSVQYHPEAGPGPHDSRYLFDQFVELMGEHRKLESAAVSNQVG